MYKPNLGNLRFFSQYLMGTTEQEWKPKGKDSHGSFALINMGTEKAIPLRVRGDGNKSTSGSASSLHMSEIHSYSEWSRRGNTPEEFLSLCSVALQT